MLRTVVTRDSDDLLQIEEWTFWLDDRNCHLVLNTYQLLRRESKRHKFHAHESYDRIRGRQSTTKLDDVPLPDDVASEARQKLIDKIVVVREM